MHNTAVATVLKRATAESFKQRCTITVQNHKNTIIEERFVNGVATATCEANALIRKYKRENAEFKPLVLIIPMPSLTNNSQDLTEEMNEAI